MALNVTITGPTAAGDLTVYPGAQPLPLASNLNYVAGQTLPNVVLVPPRKYRHLQQLGRHRQRDRRPPGVLQLNNACNSRGLEVGSPPRGLRESGSPRASPLDRRAAIPNRRGAWRLPGL